MEQLDGGSGMRSDRWNSRMEAGVDSPAALAWTIVVLLGEDSLDLTPARLLRSPSLNPR
jgi:hypothetical protein